MKISFDIDDTLIFYDKSKNGSQKLLNGESLRKGTIDLLKDLQNNHELWVYTTSLRTPWLLKLSFLLKGIKIERVINQTEHMKLCKSLNISNIPTKYPSKYGIDLHIDDSEGVVMEGEKYGFRVLRVDPEDLNWTTTIKNEIEKL
jgi:hypothetical protein